MNQVVFTVLMLLSCPQDTYNKLFEEARRHCMSVEQLLMELVENRLTNGKSFCKVIEIERANPIHYRDVPGISDFVE